jgi:serine/threonine-protein phosphatase CPPED1
MSVESFYFVQITDPQFGMITANKDYKQETVLFEKAVAIVNRLDSAFVILTGDMVNEPGDEGQLAEFLRIAGTFKDNLDIYYTAGNHDIGDAPHASNLQWYRDRIGPDWYSFDRNGWHFVVLNSCIMYKDENVPEEAAKQLAWLKNDLAQAAKRPGASEMYSRGIVVFMHHPLFLDSADEDDQYFNIPGACRKVYINLLKKYSVRIVFNGHLHQENLAIDDGLEVVTTAAVGMPLGDAQSGLRIVQICKDKIEHKYYTLESVPEHDELSSTLAGR